VLPNTNTADKLPSPRPGTKLLSPLQVEVPNPELYQYDGEVLAKAEEMGKPGLVDIKQKQVGGSPEPAPEGCCMFQYLSFFLFGTSSRSR
jgi:hypothetical protein